MKKHLVILVAMIAVIAVAMPSFALEFKYGGLYRLRLQSQDNIADGNDDIDDNGNWIDQRLRMYFTFVASENLQVVTKWELDTTWGDGRGFVANVSARNGSGGGVSADSVNLEMKNVYVDFAIPCTPVRSTMGVQHITLLSGWIVDDDFSAAMFTTKFDPITVAAGYIAGRNVDVTSTEDNVDDLVLSVGYANGPFKANLVAFWQDAHDTGTSVDPGLLGNGSFTQSPNTPVPAGIFPTSFTGLLPETEDNQLFDLGLSAEYRIDWMSAYINFVKNFGSFDSGIDDFDDDYTGWMLEGYTNFYYGPFTFTLGGFYTSGEDIEDVLDDGDFSNYFRYPAGVSHYWSEIMGLGTLDVSVGGLNSTDRNAWQAGYASADHPSNLWMINAGAAWQALETTKLTLNYYYIGTSQDVLGDFSDLSLDDSVGHELDLYVDQKVVDGLMLRLVGAYLFAEDAYTVFPDDDDAYEVGAQLQWAF